MPDNARFAEFLARLRSGDARAADELVRDDESAVRVVIRAKLTDPGLKRLFDTADFCQSVFKSFFVRAAAGEFDLHDPSQLIGLLASMARNKLAGQARRGYVTRREVGDESAPGSALADPGPGPNQQVVWRDLLAAVRGRLSDEERQLADRRARLQGWEQIAAELGGSPEALRKKLTRALDRVARQLGLDEPDHG